VKHRSLFLVVGLALAFSILSTGAAAADTGMPPLPPNPGLPNVPPPTLGSSGALNPQIAAWAKTFADQASAAIDNAKSALSVESQNEQFASLWAKAVAQANAIASTPVTPPPIPTLPPPPALPPLPTLSDPSEEWTTIFGGVPTLPNMNMPSYATLTINPVYSKTVAGLSCSGPFAQTGANNGCSYLATPSGLADYLYGQLSSLKQLGPPSS
jgi:hypothetical protein